jgi:chromosome segregation ATPase
MAKSVTLDLELEQKDTKISDLTVLLQSFEILEKEKSQLEGKLTEATKLYVGLETDKNKIIKETSAGLNSALLESQQKEITISDLKIEIGDWKTKFGDSEEKYRNLKKDLSDMTSNIELMHVESQDKDCLFSDMQSNLKNISEKVIHTLESDNKTLTSQLDAALLGLETIKATAQNQETKITKLESELSQVESKLVDTEHRYSNAEHRYSDAERSFTETIEQGHSDLENLKRDFEASEATLREKLAKIAEIEAALAALRLENLRSAQQNSTDAGALEDLRGKFMLLDLEFEQKDARISDLTGLLQSFENLEKERMELEGKLSEATKLYVGLESDKNKIIEETSAGLKSALLESQRRETTISSLKTEIADWKAKFGDSEEKSRNLKKELLEMISNFDLIRIESQDKDSVLSDMQLNLKKISEKEKVIQTLESDNKTISVQLEGTLL